MSTMDLGDTVLGVWAHPDDEAFLSGGLMAKAVGEGRRVVVVTATRGEAGTSDPRRWPPDRLSDIRSRELYASLAALGVTEHHWLGHADGGCAAVPLGLGSAQVASVIDEVRPDTIVTFGPDGMTGHPDHRAVSMWTARAVEQTGSPAAVLNATLSRDFLSRYAGPIEEFDVFFAGPAPWTPPHELAMELVLDDRALDAKLVALRAQASQTAAMVARLGEERFRAWWGTEWFADGRAIAVAAA